MILPTPSVKQWRLLLVIQTSFGSDCRNYLTRKEYWSKSREEKTNFKTKNSNINCWSGRRQPIQSSISIPPSTPSSSPNYILSTQISFWLRPSTRAELATWPRLKNRYDNSIFLDSITTFAHEVSPTWTRGWRVSTVWLTRRGIMNYMESITIDNLSQKNAALLSPNLSLLKV